MKNKVMVANLALYEMLAVCEQYRQLHSVGNETIIVNEFGLMERDEYKNINRNGNIDLFELSGYKDVSKKAQWKTNSYNHNSRNNRKTKSK